MTRVMVIDDDAAILDLFREVLTEDGVETVTCQRGAEAHACVRATVPDVIILDVHLEARDAGWSVLAALKADAALRRIPVVVCTADKYAVERHAAELAHDGYTVLDKPFELDTLLALVHRLTDRPDTAPTMVELAQSA